MESYYVSCKKIVQEDSSARKTKQNKLILLSKCSICGKKKSMFIKNKGLHQTFALIKFKMNEIINKFLLTGENFIPELHLEPPGFTYSACESFTKRRERIRKFREKDNEIGSFYSTN